MKFRIGVVEMVALVAVGGIGLALAAATARTGEYLGKLGGSAYDAQSTSNPYGSFGSPYSAKNVQNPYSRWASAYSSESPRNPFATRQPILIGDLTGQGAIGD